MIKPKEALLKKTARTPGKNRQETRTETNPEPEFEKHVLAVDRVARTVAGGKRVRFRALVILGNRAGKVGMGVGKANEVSEAVEKATTRAKKNLLAVPIKEGTIPHQIELKQGASHIILKPARPGTSIVAGGTIRVICTLAGIKNIVAKILGSANKINNSKIVLEAFKILAEEQK